MSKIFKKISGLILRGVLYIALLLLILYSVLALSGAKASFLSVPLSAYVAEKSNGSIRLKIKDVRFDGFLGLKIGTAKVWIKDRGYLKVKDFNLKFQPLEQHKILISATNLDYGDVYGPYTTDHKSNLFAILNEFNNIITKRNTFVARNILLNIHSIKPILSITTNDEQYNTSLSLYTNGQNSSNFGPIVAAFRYHNQNIDIPIKAYINITDDVISVDGQLDKQNILNRQYALYIHETETQEKPTLFEFNVKISQISQDIVLQGSAAALNVPLITGQDKYVMLNAELSEISCTNMECVIASAKIITPDFLITGKVELEKTGANFHLVSNSSVDINTMLKYWPINTIKAPRKWIEKSIQYGVINRAEFYYTYPDKNMKISLGLRDASLIYNKKAPVAKNIKADIDIIDKKASITIHNGNVLQCSATGKSSLDWSRPQQPDKFDLDLDTTCSIKDTLAIASAFINQDKANELQSLPISISGEVQSKVFVLGELNDTPNKIKIDSYINNVNIEDSKKKYVFKNGKLRASFNESNLEISGFANLNGIIQTDLTFTKPAKGEEALIIHLKPTTEELKTIGIDLTNLMHGKIDILARMPLNSEAKIADLYIDLKNASMRIPHLGLGKKIGDGGDFTSQVNLAHSEKYDIVLQNYKINTQKFQSTGDIFIKENNALIKAKSNIGKKSDFAADIDISDNSTKILITGKQLDLSNMRSEISKSRASNKSKTQHDIQSKTKNKKNEVNIDIKTKSILLGDNISMTPKSFTLNCKNDICRKGEIELVAHDGSSIEVILDGMYIYMQMENAGIGAGILGITKNMRGGKCIFDGRFKDDFSMDFDATIYAKDFYVINAPMLMTLFAVSSMKPSTIQGLGDLLSNKGVRFVEAKCNIDYSNKIMSLKDCNAKGPIIGITANGTVDFNTLYLNINGVLVPQNFLNSIVSGIPLIGEAISGGKNYGLIATNYKMSGYINNKVDIVVNPLSIFTPGFLRKIFELSVNTSP